MTDKAETKKTANRRPQEKEPKGLALSENAPPATSGTRPQIRRRRWLRVSFAVCVILPIVLGSIYFLFVASDRYVSGAGFSVRGIESGGGVDVIGAFTGLASSGSTTSDSYIILKYLTSRDLLDRLQEDFDFKKAYSADDIDFLKRMDPGLSVEDTVKYWSSMITTSFESTSGIITFEVQAFKPQDAERIAQLVLGYTRTLVNRLSEEAREDTVRFATAEVERAEARLREALLQVRIFREQEQSINPAASAQLQIELIGALEKQLIDIRARMSALSQSVDDNAPSMNALKHQAKALELQIEETNKAIGVANKSGAGTALSGLLASFEALEVEKNFAQQAYTSSLSSLEQARVEASRQQRYLALYSSPRLPEEALYPQRFLGILILLIVVTSLWGIGTLIVYSVRDHMS